MRQRIPSRAWYSPGRPGRRPRVLVEDDDTALAVSDFSLFAQAGFDVAYCSGPGDNPGDCPVLRGQRCRLAAGADVVLHGLDPELGVAAALLRQQPGLRILAWQRHGTDGRPRPVPDGCEPLAEGSSVPGQIAAARSALPRKRPA
jgi:hypothetical protein